MKLAFTLGVMFIVAAAMPYAASSGSGPPQPGDIILQFPSPGTSPSDLAWDGTHLWAADDGTDTVYKLDPSDGTVGPAPRLASIPGPRVASRTAAAA